MKATLRLSRRVRYAEYLALERDSPHRNEYLDGVIVAMAGGSDEHNAITSRLAMLFGMRLGRSCRCYSPDQRFWIASSARGRYSDGSIIYGKPEHPPHDDQASTNPVIVLEVLSPSTEGDDDGDKRIDFQSLPALQAYVLVAQDERCVRVYRRDERGGWRRDADVHRGSETFELPSLTAPIRVAELYDDILDEAGRSLLR